MATQCPPCKVILDGGVLIAAAILLAQTVGAGHPLHAPSMHLANTLKASRAGIKRGFRMRVFDEQQIEEAHAWSELQCHRAKEIRGWARRFARATAGNDTKTIGDMEKHVETLYDWAEEDRLFATKLVGGEFRGTWEIDGTKGIRKNGDTAQG